MRRMAGYRTHQLSASDERAARACRLLRGRSRRNPLEAGYRSHRTSRRSRLTREDAALRGATSSQAIAQKHHRAPGRIAPSGDSHGAGIRFVRFSRRRVLSRTRATRARNGAAGLSALTDSTPGGLLCGDAPMNASPYNHGRGNGGSNGGTPRQGRRRRVRLRARRLAPRATATATATAAAPPSTTPASPPPTAPTSSSSPTTATATRTPSPSSSAGTSASCTTSSSASSATAPPPRTCSRKRSSRSTSRPSSSTRSAASARGCSRSPPTRRAT